MASDNETVAEIVKRVRRDCSSYPLPNAAGEKLKLVREINDAHKREMDGLRALVGELTNALLYIINCEGALSGGCDEDIAWTCPVSKQCGIVVRAREVANG